MKLTISQDIDATDPSEFMHGTIVCWHKRYSLGEDHDYRDARHFFNELAERHDDSFNEWYDDENSDRAEAIVNEHCVILPVFMYDHSGITLNTKGFGCRWDSGQVGFIYIDAKTLRRGFNGDRSLAVKALEGTIETYSAYVGGDVYCYTLEDNGDIIDGCCGFYSVDDLESALRDNGYDANTLIKDAEYAN